MPIVETPRRMMPIRNGEDTAELFPSGQEEIAGYPRKFLEKTVDGLEKNVQTVYILTLTCFNTIS